MKKVLFVYNHERSFIQKDMEILSGYFEVKPFFYNKEKNILKLRKLVNWCDLIYCWFASYHTLWPFFLGILYKKQKVVVVGGYDACGIEGYGIFSTWRGRRLAKFIYKNADLILVVDESLKKDILKHSKLKISNKIQVLPTGYNSQHWKPKGKKEPIVLTVCYVDKSNWWRKGINTLIEVAEKLSNVKFYCVGKVHGNIKLQIDKSPKNIIFTNWISDEELLRFYQKSKVYCQLSKYEGLPNVLCEAMLCECIPVGTKQCGIPTAIGDTGFYVPYGDVDKTIKAIKKALNSSPELGKKARKRIKERFPTERRKEELLKCLINTK